MSSPAEPSGRIVLVRHGQTQWSRDGRHTGRTDLPLTPDGERDARLLAPRLAEFEFAAVLSSPLSRARRTAELAGLDAVLDDDLAEWDYGGYEGLTTPQIRESLGDPAWTVFGDGVVPGQSPGETVEEVAARASRVLDRVADPLTRGDVALVAHGHLLHPHRGLPAPGGAVRGAPAARRRRGLRARPRAWGAGGAHLERHLSLSPARRAPGRGQVSGQVCTGSLESMCTV